ncbi:MAG TPA: hypothetical protein DCE18_08505 [Syntrophobacteraceae bacterium]|jgi:hypothetical protein|nr:hypothetical protein [Syntrophobacteraceae bacterium]
MSRLTEFKRLNFFTGFFTTAKDWTDGQSYHLEKRKLHNRGLHSPGVIRGELDELRVVATRGLEVQLLPGVALDKEGNELYLGQSQRVTLTPGDYTLPQLVYLALRHGEEGTDWVEYNEANQYCGFTRIKETPQLEITTSRPDNQTKLEIARIQLNEGVTAVSDAADPDNPAANEIDLRFVVQAGSVGVVEEGMTPEDMERLIQLMRRTRRDFAALSSRYSTSSATDVRQGATTLEMLARTGCLRLEQVSAVMNALADVEQDVAQELAVAYTFLVNSTEFQEYQGALFNLAAALRDGEGVNTLFTCQDRVAEAARELAEMATQRPVAEAGNDVTVATGGDEAVVVLDGSQSKVFGGRTLARYHWRLLDSELRAPLGNAGVDQTVATRRAEAEVTLDASGSYGFDGRTIIRYRWEEKE